MPSTIHLRRKIKSITNTKQITRAMQMVAASKMRRAQEAVLGTRAYASTGYEILAELQSNIATQQSKVSHPLLAERPIQRITLVAIASDRGLAGGYNSNVLRKTLMFLEEHQDKEVQVITVGRKIQEGLQRVGVPIFASFTDFASQPTSNDIVPIAKLTTEAFLAGQTDQVSIIYTHFYSTLRQVAQDKQILPFRLEDQPVQADKQRDNQYIFEPEPKRVLDYIVPRLVEMQLLQALLDSIASEHSSRMLAMKNATDNASELIDDLRLTFNGVRQANITREIAEISAGAQA